MPCPRPALKLWRSEQRVPFGRKHRGRITTRGLPYMTSANFSAFWTPSPLVAFRNQMILFLLSAFWGPPPPTQCRRRIYKPLSTTAVLFAYSSCTLAVHNAAGHSLSSFVVREWKTETKFKHSTCTRSLFFLSALHTRYNARCYTIFLKLWVFVVE